MESKGKISIIVPVYNMEKYLCRCVDSILAQTYQDIQVILVDDGSKDRSSEICDSYGAKDPRITVIHQENGGLSSARNAGIDAARGEYLGFVDSDDYIAPQMYEKLIGAMKFEGKIANIMYVRVDDHGITSPSRVPHTTDEIISISDYVKEVMLGLGDISVCTKLFHRSMFADLRFQEDKLNEDLLFMIEAMARTEQVRFIGYVGYYYFSRSGSISSGYGKAVIDMVGNSLVAMDSVKVTFPELKTEAERFAIYQHMAYLLLVPGKYANRTNKVYVSALRFVRRHLWKSLGNPYLSLKNKLTLCGLMIMPKTMATYYQTKHR